MKRSILLSAFLAIVLTGFGQNALTDEKPQKLSLENPGKELLPVLTFDYTDYDFGQVQYGDTLTHTFVFENTGKSPLELETVSTSCGCTAAYYSKLPIAPNNTGVVIATVVPKRKGPFVQHITVTANTEAYVEVIEIKGVAE